MEGREEEDREAGRPGNFRKDSLKGSQFLVLGGLVPRRAAIEANVPSKVGRRLQGGTGQVRILWAEW